MIDNTNTSNADRAISLLLVPINHSDATLLALMINSKVHTTIGAESTLQATSTGASISNLCSKNEMLILSEANLDLQILPYAITCRIV